MRRFGRWVQPVLGGIVGIAALWWIFHDVRLEDLRRDVGNIRWIWVVPALACDTFGYFLQGLRWSLLLRTLGRLSPLRAAQAVYAGLFANETLPMRAGEMVRAGIVARWLRAPVMRVVPSLAVERLFDGVWLAIYIGIVAIFVQLPRGFVRAADLLGLVVLAGCAVFLLVVFGPWKTSQEKVHEIAEGETETPGFLRRLARALDHARSETRLIGRSRLFFASFFVSALPQACEATALWLLLQAYAIPLSIWSGIAAALILRLGTAIPAAPGNVGTWQLICVVALAILGVPKPQAAGFSVVAFVLLTFPLWAIGWLALTRAGLTPGKLLKRVSVDEKVAR